MQILLYVQILFICVYSTFTSSLSACERGANIGKSSEYIMRLHDINFLIFIYVWQSSKQEQLVPAVDSISRKSTKNFRAFCLLLNFMEPFSMKMVPRYRKELFASSSSIFFAFFKMFMLYLP